jgi:alpha-tubulin suppressor-like RCC1 family protein
LLGIGAMVLLSSCNTLRSVEQADAGRDFNCALHEDGRISCWGRNHMGQLGNGTTLLSNTEPVWVDGIEDAVAVSVGDAHACAVLRDGTARCWGFNANANLGDGTLIGRRTPVQVVGITNVESIAVGAAHSCAVLADGKIRCWGSGFGGKLGNGATANQPVPVEVVGITSAATVTVGNEHSCAVLDDGDVRCWGRNVFGQLGDGTATNRSVPVEVAGVDEAVSVTAGGAHTCAVLVDETVRCWGSNAAGQVGDGSTLDRSEPVAVPGIDDASAITAGAAHTCATLVDATVECWGSNAAWQLGVVTATITQTTPVPVPGLATVAATTGGLGHTCAVLDDGTVRCWGNNDLGQLGDQTTRSRLAPAVVVGAQPPLVGTVEEVASGFTHTCARFASGQVGCWGNNYEGQMGDGTRITGDGSINVRLGPVPVVGISDATAIAAGNDHSCAVLADGRVQCWGDNTNGKLGSGSSLTLFRDSVPVTVATVDDAVGVAAGYYHTCVLREGGTVRCWGMGLYGQLGDGTETNRNTPLEVDVLGITDAVAITAGAYHNCALRADGTVWCWGRNIEGQVGDGTISYANRRVPVQVIGITDAVSIGSGLGHTCAVLADGTVRCWGDNIGGQLGDGTTTTQPVPVEVVGVTDALEVSGSDAATCAVLGDGSISCWGQNEFGALGDGTAEPRTAPVRVVGIDDARSVALGGLMNGLDHSCAVLGDGTLRCWGDNTHGQLGDGTTIDRLTPRPVVAAP